MHSSGSAHTLVKLNGLNVISAAKPADCTALIAGKLHFVKFETARIDECIDFIEAKGLHRVSGSGGASGDVPEGKVRVVATGGGAYKYADIFQVRGIPLL